MGRMKDLSWVECHECGDEFPAERWALGYRVCLFCGEEAARMERKSWCVVQEYGKGGYMYVPAEAAKHTLLDTNQKNPRS